MESKKNNLNMWDRIMMAITFAEAGETKTASDILDNRTEKQLRPESKTRKESAQRPQLRV